MRFTVGPENYRADLIEAAREAWRVFENGVGEIPFQFTPPVLFDVNGRTAGGIAECALFNPQDPRRESALIVLSERFFNKPESERNLTLLHECIHLRFKAGPLRQHVIESQRLEQVHRLPRIDETEECRVRSLHLHVACSFRNFIEEILAELYLKAHYETHLAARIAYYREMRRASFARWREPDVPSSLRPWFILHETLRNDLGVQLAEGHPERAEFAAMSSALDDELRRLCSGPEFAAHQETRQRLMAATLEPLKFDAPAYALTFDSILSPARS